MFHRASPKREACGRTTRLLAYARVPIWRGQREYALVAAVSDTDLILVLLDCHLQMATVDDRRGESGVFR